MKQPGSMLKKMLVVMVATLLPMLLWTLSVQAEGTDTWQHEVAIYGWFAGVDGTVGYPGGPGSGEDFSVETSDIIENLNMIFMGGIESRYNKWSILADVVYMDVGGDSGQTFYTGNGTAINGSVDMDLSSWVLSGAVGYNVFLSEQGRLAILGGVRYTSVDVDVAMGLQGPLPVAHPPATVSEFEGVLDGIIGVRGHFKLNENWYVPYHADIGTGGSDFSYQLFAGIGYKFTWGDIRFGYRHLSFDLGDDNLMQELVMSGPVLGVGFRF